jgi:hypothetical protein
VTYGELQAVLDGLDSAIGAAEAHGCLCGALCARAGYATPEWAGELIDGERVTGLDGQSQAVLDALHEQTLEALKSQEFGFAPLVPDDSATLEARVEALSAWCAGFLYGVGTGGAGTDPAAVDDVDEILRDFGAIVRAQLDPQEAAQGGEEAFVELFEYVRAGAQLAFDELAALRSAQPDAGSVH